MTVKVVRKDFGKKRAQRLLREPRKKLYIGVLDREAARRPREYKGRSVGEVARWHEYGLGGNPRRSWLRDPIYEEGQEIVKRLAAATMRVLFANEKEEQALGNIGSWLRRELIDRIRYGNELLRNADATIRKKGFDLPLIDSENFIESIRWEVVD